VPHRFTPLVGVDDLIGRRLRGVADKLCGGSMTPLLTHLVRGRSLKKTRDRRVALAHRPARPPTSAAAK
jgi:predicted transcriptional regulator